jgi:hypothetical protein
MPQALSNGGIQVPRTFDDQVTVLPIRVKYETVCSRCGGKVLRGESATWYSAQDKREEFRPKQRIVCQGCEPPQRRSAGVSSNPAKRGTRNFRDYLEEKSK